MKKESFITMVACAAFLLVSCKRGPSKTKEQEAKESEEIAAAAAAASAKFLEEQEAIIRGQCKLKPGAKVHFTPDDDVRLLCRARVKELLKVPGSAEFPSMSSEGLFQSDDGCVRIYSSTVTAKNAFGVEVQNRFTCRWDPRTDVYKVSVSP